MSRGSDVLVIVPQGLPGIAAHHEATSGMGALDPAAAPFLYPPHTAAQCVAHLHAAGLSVAVADSWGRRRSLDETLTEIASSKAQVLAVQVSHGTEHADENFLRLLRRVVPAGSHRQVLLFGLSAHFVAAPWLEAGFADAALSGEPEEGIVAAVAAVAAGQTGLLAANALCPDCYDAANLLTDLDALPFPAWASVPWPSYERMVSLLSSRGCPAGCRFCAYVVAQGRHVRSQSVERTLAEWDWLARSVQPGYLMVRDAVFAHDRARVVALCEGLAARNSGLRWGCESRPEHFDGELLHLMRAAGCEDIKIGLESGDPLLLAQLGRVPAAEAAEAYLAQVGRVAQACQLLGIACRVFVITGVPGENAAALARTIRALRQLGRHVIVHALPYQAHPGTSLPGPSAAVANETLHLLQTAPKPQPAPWRRGWWWLRDTVLRAHPGRRSSARSLPVGLRTGASPDVQAEYGRRSSLRTGASPGVQAEDERRSLLRTGASPGVQAEDERRSSLRTGASPDIQAEGRARVFLTGGNGFVGGHVAAALVAAGATVVALVRPGSALGALAELPAASVEVVRGDLVDHPALWLPALRGCRYCFHVAALYAGPDQADAMYAVNVRGTGVLLAACAEAGVQRVVHTSSVGTVGRPADPAALPDERTRFNLWHSASHYVRSKYLGELVARAWSASGLEVIIVQPTAPVGAGDARPTATGARILAALRGEITPYPPGGVNHVPVQDVAEGHLLAALHGVPGETYILGHRDGNLDHAAFLRLVAEAAGGPLLRAPQRRGAVGQLPAALTVNPSRAVHKLGLPQSDLLTAFREAVAWLRRDR